MGPHLRVPVPPALPGASAGGMPPAPGTYSISAVGGDAAANRDATEAREPFEVSGSKMRFLSPCPHRLRHRMGPSRLGSRSGWCPAASRSPGSRTRLRLTSSGPCRSRGGGSRRWRRVRGPSVPQTWRRQAGAHWVPIRRDARRSTTGRRPAGRSSSRPRWCVFAQRAQFDGLARGKLCAVQRPADLVDDEPAAAGRRRISWPCWRAPRLGRFSAEAASPGATRPFGHGARRLRRQPIFRDLPDSLRWGARTVERRLRPMRSLLRV
jgi:hypothetical protein